MITGDQVSQTVRAFAQSRGWEENAYDCWYHDFPIWIVRHGDRRAQAAYNGDQLYVIGYTFRAGKRSILQPSRNVDTIEELRDALAHFLTEEKCRSTN